MSDETPRADDLARAERCQLCHDNDASHRFDIHRESGTGAVYACDDCSAVALSLISRTPDGLCLWCANREVGEYVFSVYGDPTESHGICGGCRSKLEAGGEAIREGVETPEIEKGGRGYDERGNPIPLSDDTCNVCGARRDKRPDGFAIEIMAPFGEVEYLCGRCRDRGRGMK